jgi:hypothetical protein
MRGVGASGADTSITMSTSRCTPAFRAATAMLTVASSNPLWTG